VAVLLACSLPRTIQAGDPAPAFEAEMAPCPSAVVGPAGGTWTGNLEIRLATVTNPLDVGARGWLLSLASSGVEIIDITTRGTAGARVDDDPPGLRTPAGFEKTELTSRGCCLDPACSGALSALVLSTDDPGITLPPTGTVTIARITVSGPIPSVPGESIPGMVAFLDGCLGSGTPVFNTVNLGGINHDALWQDCAFAIRAGSSSFRRGDSNDDGAVDISDALHILGCKFLGERCPDCRDAADANDDGSVDISDPIHVLSFLFSSGSPPPAPGGACGTDPSEDSLPDCFYSSCSGS
jgi:hypothetical protein